METLTMQAPPHSPILLAMTLFLVACTGPQGPQGQPGFDGSNGSDGTDGADGTDGTDGTDGRDCWDLNGNGVPDLLTEDLDGDGVVDVNDCRGRPGQDFRALGYVGMIVCASCHDDPYQQLIRSGHPYKLTPTYGAAPVPAAGFPGTYPPNPPAGRSWADTSYVIGGAGWKARFIDADGYVITSGAAATPVQYNLADGSWVTYHTQDEPGTKVYDCGGCHTTGYSPIGSQGGLPGIVGTWSEPGITCEACHGPGGNHAADPENVEMPIVRDSELCGRCHVRGAPQEIPASGGFIRHHQQWNEMSNSLHRALDCVDCHDPHRSAVYADPTWNPDRGMVVDCENCHFEQALHQNTVVMGVLACKDCHLPMASKSALGNLDAFTGDLRSHSFAINPWSVSDQFYANGSLSYPYLSLDYACRNCHSAAGLALEKTDQELQAAAIGYHDPP
jgi:hypothetical protein